MANTTTYLDQPAGQHIGSHLIKVEKVVDFTKEKVASGGTLDVLNIPAGACIIDAGILTLTTEATVTLTLGTAEDSGNNDLCTAATLSTAGTMNRKAAATEPVYCHTATTLRSAVAAADAAAAKVNYWAVYSVLDTIAA